MAQSEAYYGCSQWVDYFVHAGHLSIRGLKMSKSLKNFVTIRSALESHPPRHLRLMFLMSHWDRGMVYSDQTLEDARSKDERLRNFFQGVRALPCGGAGAQSWRAAEAELSAQVRAARARVHAALCDSVDTPRAMAALLELVGQCNAYMAREGPAARWAAAHEAARYVAEVLAVFGVFPARDHAGLPVVAEKEGKGREAVLGPVMQRVSAFRDGVRALARSGKGEVDAGGLLRLCDAFRDEACVDLGIRLEDRPDGTAVVKSLSEDPEELRREIADRRAREREAARRKRENKRALREKELRKWEAAAVEPEAYFRGEQHAGRFGAFDEQHVPTHGPGMEALPKAQRKAAEKEMGRHLQARRQLVERSGGDVPAFLEAIRREIAALSVEE